MRDVREVREVARKINKERLLPQFDFAPRWQ